VSCAARRSLGVFVLGALDPGERAALARHLDGCDECRRELAEMVPLPALLARIPTGDVEQLAAPPHRRLGRTGVAVALLIFLGVGVNLARHAVDTPSTAATASGWDPASGVRMAAQIAAAPPGAHVEMRLAGVPSSERCRLEARAKNGQIEVVAHWRATYAGAASVDATSSIAARDLSELSVVTEDGKRLLQIPVRAAAQ
jgi:anti-sigma factor RsiW